MIFYGNEDKSLYRLERTFVWGGRIIKNKITLTSTVQSPTPTLITTQSLTPTPTVHLYSNIDRLFFLTTTIIISAMAIIIHET